MLVTKNNNKPPRRTDEDSDIDELKEHLILATFINSYMKHETVSNINESTSPDQPPRRVLAECAHGLLASLLTYEGDYKTLMMLRDRLRLACFVCWLQFAIEVL